MTVTPNLPVLVDEDVWPEFAEAILSVDSPWVAPSGRSYVLSLEGCRLKVDLVVPELGLHPRGADIDDDLLELACLVMDRVGGEWSGENLRRVAQVWATGQVR